MNKKIIAMVSIVVMVVATSGATLVSARGLNNLERQGFFASLFNKEGTSLEELINTYEEIQLEKEELNQLYELYGIELPDLSDEEKKQVVQTFRELKKAGYSRYEIRDEIVDLLIGFGVNIPGLTSEQRIEIRSKLRSHLENEYGYVFVELSPEQKAYIKQTWIQLKRDGLDEEQIRSEIIALYENYGGVIPTLTDEQKEEIYDWTISMVELDYNIDLPDVSYDQQQEIKDQKDLIKSLQKELRWELRDTSWLNRFRFVRYVKNNGSD